MQESLRTDPTRDEGVSPVGQEPTRKARLLVAEDAQCVRHVLGSFLGRMDLKAEMVENGKTACEMAEKSKAEGRPYDLILLDVQMPQMNGHEAAKWLREHGWTGPIVAVTAYDREVDRKKCLDAGCDEHLSKPITETALRNVVTRHLSGTDVNESAETSAVSCGSTRTQANESANTS